MNWKISLITVLFLNLACGNNSKTREESKNEIYKAEKAFEAMAAEKGIAEAFHYFADENAIIKRENDTLISGKANIKNYYSKIDDKNTKVSWTPDFIEISECGTLGYTYGKYIWTITDTSGKITEYKGIFHTVWKKQDDNSWKYVWD